MITRAQIRRQLRKEGGIMNAVPRQKYLFGGVGDVIGDVLGKAGKVVKKVVKSPIGKAALLGLGGAGLMGYGPMSGLGARIGGSGIGQFFKGMGPKLLGTAAGASAGPMPYLQKGVQQFTPGLLGKLGLTKGGGSIMPTILGGVTAAGLMTYFIGKGKTEEEAMQLAQDVKRGKGLGLDLIKADVKKYRTGDLSSSQMFDKGYHFLTPRDYIGAKGGRVGLRSGSPEEGVKSLEAGALPIKVEGDVRPENMKMAEIPRDMTLENAVKNFKLSNGRDPKNMQEVIEFFKNRKLSASGGRIGKFGGGMGVTMSSVPTGMPRVNTGGIRELDYRQEGGFVPVGVKEKADDVPAMLSKNEFVMTADAVKAAGGGSVEKGAQRMYDTMKRLEGKVI